MNREYIADILYWQDQAAISYRAATIEMLANMPEMRAQTIRFQRRARREAGIARRLLAQLQGWRERNEVQDLL
jgi:hypothetical protein